MSDHEGLSDLEGVEELLPDRMVWPRAWLCPPHLGVEGKKGPENKAVTILLEQKAGHRERIPILLAGRLSGEDLT